MRIAQKTPPACACCGQPHMVSGGQWVDFEAAWDGPVLDTGEGNSRVAVSIDDLVVCEKCVRQAGELIGLENAPDLRGQISEQRKEIEELRKEVRAKDRTISNMNATVETAIKFPIHRPSGKPKITGPKEVDEGLKKLRLSRKQSEERKPSGTNR